MALTFTPWFTGAPQDWNSYATVAQADGFLPDLGGIWVALTSVQKEAYLVGATQWVDERFGQRFVGCESCECDQKTCLPRTRLFTGCDDQERDCADPLAWVDVSEIVSHIAFAFAAKLPIPFPPLMLAGLVVDAGEESRVGGRRSCDNWLWYKNNSDSRVGRDFLRVVEQRLINAGLINPIRADKSIYRLCDNDTIVWSGVSWTW